VTPGRRAVTDVVQVHTLELTKVGETDDGTPAWAWLRFVAVTTTEELDMAASLDPDIAEAAMIVRRYNADEQARLDLFSHEKFMLQQWYIREDGRDEGQQKSRQEVARNALGLGLSVDQVVQITGLTRDEIQLLKPA